MPQFLVSRHNKNLTDSVPLFNRSQLKYIFREHSYEYLPVSFILINDKILPFFSFLINKRNTVDVEQEKNLKSLLVRYKLFIIPEVYVNLECVVPALILMNFLAFGDHELFLFALFLKELLFFHEILSPPVVVCGVIAVIFRQGGLDEFLIF